MAENLTRPTETSPAEVVAAIEHPTRRRDAEYLLALMARLTGEPAVMWGRSIIGFGSYHYRYASGREGDAPVVGFSAQRTRLSLYGLLGAPEAENLLARLGKHRRGAGCLYVNTLDDVDTAVLESLIDLGRRHTLALYPPDPVAD